AVMLLLPHISPRRYFFAITVPAGFRSTEGGRASLRRSYRWVWGALAVTAAMIIASGRSAATAFGFVTMLPMAVGVAVFLRERTVVRRLAPSQPQVHEADLATDDHLPRWVLLALPAFAPPLAAAEWLRTHWEEIPAKFPIHRNAAGQPDHWAERTSQAIYA